MQDFHKGDNRAPNQAGDPLLQGQRCPECRGPSSALPALPGVKRGTQQSQAGDPLVQSQRCPERRGTQQSQALMPEEQQHSLRKSLEVVVPIYLRPVHHGYLPEHLQSTENQDTSVSSTPTISSASPASYPLPNFSPMPFTSGHVRSEAKHIGFFPGSHNILAIKPNQRGR